MGNPIDWETIRDQGDRRNEVLYAWLRWLVLLEAGLFSVMAGQVFAHALPPQVVWWAKVALLSNGASILFGAIAIFGERALHQRLLRAMAEDAIESLLDEQTQGNTIHFGNVPKVCLISEWLCYLAFVFAVCSWMWVVWLF